MLKPDLKFLLAHPAHFIALGFGSGLSPVAPGTAGTLAAWLLFPLIKPYFSDAGFLAFLVAAFAVGVFAASLAGFVAIVIAWPESVTYWLDRGTGVDPASVRIEVPMPEPEVDNAVPVFREPCHAV